MAHTLPKSVRLVAILNVVAWGGFWAFGYLALSSGQGAKAETIVAVFLAALGAALGIWAYMILTRASESTGYEQAYMRAKITGSGSVNKEKPQ